MSLKYGQRPGDKIAMFQFQPLLAKCWMFTNLMDRRQQQARDVSHAGLESVPGEHEYVSPVVDIQLEYMQGSHRYLHWRLLEPKNALHNYTLTQVCLCIS